MRFTLGFLVFLASSLVHAQPNYLADVGLAATDNANFEANDKDADLILSAKPQVTFRANENEFGIHLNYRDYLKQNSNDSLSWRIYDQYKPAEASWSYTGALVGRQYTNGSPGLTDTSFSNIGWDFQAEQTQELENIGEVSYGPGLRGRYYSGSGQRSDHQLFGFIDFSRDQSPTLTFGFSGELAYLLSSDSSYSQFGFDLSGNVMYLIAPDLSWFNEILLGGDSFTNRAVDVQTAASKSRGTARTNFTKENELFTTFGLTSELTKRFTPSFDGRLGLSLTNQSSRSGTQDYAVNEIYTSLILRF